MRKVLTMMWAFTLMVVAEGNVASGRGRRAGARRPRYGTDAERGSVAHWCREQSEHEV
jgi:hypothetical protein